MPLPLLHILQSDGNKPVLGENEFFLIAAVLQKLCGFVKAEIHLFLIVAIRGNDHTKALIPQFFDNKILGVGDVPITSGHGAGIYLKKLYSAG